MKKAVKGNSYTEKQFAEIENSLKVKLSNNQKELINWAKRKWEASNLLLPRRIPSIEILRKDRQQKIDDLKNKISDLISLLEAEGHLIESPRYALDRLIDELNMAYQFAKSAQKKEGETSEGKAAQKAGRIPELYREEFILDLAKIYKDVTGKPPKKPYRNVHARNKFDNPFLRFTEAFMNKTGIAKAIIKAFEKYPHYTE